jgi:hypothetical protein
MRIQPNHDQQTPSFRTIILVVVGVIVGIATTLCAQKWLAASHKPSSPPPMASLSAKSLLPESSGAGACLASQPSFGAPSSQEMEQPGQLRVTLSKGKVLTVPAGVQVSETISGYPICVGSRAVDYNQAQSQSPSPVYVTPVVVAPPGTQIVPAAPQYYVNSQLVLVDENGNLVAPTARPVGRNGLVSNPCVDPPSTRGAAFDRNR